MNYYILNKSLNSGNLEIQWNLISEQFFKLIINYSRFSKREILNIIILNIIKNNSK